MMYISRRYLLATQGRLFARALTLAAVVSVAIGVFAMLVVLGTMHGFRFELEQKLLGFAPHLVVRSPNGDDLGAPLLAWQTSAHVAAHIFPVVEGEVVAQPIGREGYADLGVKIRGSSPDMLEFLSGANFYFASTLRDTLPGTAAEKSLASQNAQDEFGMIVGSDVLSALDVHPDDVHGVALIAPLGLLDPLGTLRPLRRTFRVTGFFHSGLYQQDSTLVFMALPAARAVLGTQANAAWYIFLVDRNATDAVAKKLRAYFGDTIAVRTWSEQNQKLFGALQIEQAVMTLLLTLTMAIAGVAITGVVLMQVTTRQRDFAILSAMGASPAQLRRLVFGLGAWIGATGSALGLAAASALTWWTRTHPVRLPESFYLDHLPLEPTLWGTIAIVCVGVGMAIGAAWYPARVATSTSPAVGLRYE